MYISLPLFLEGFPWGSDDKASASNAGDPGSIPGSGSSPGEGNGSSLSPVGYSPWGRQESDTIERLHFTSLHFRFVLKEGEKLLVKSCILSKQSYFTTFILLQDLINSFLYILLAFCWVFS